MRNYLLQNVTGKLINLLFLLVCVLCSVCNRFLFYLLHRIWFPNDSNYPENSTKMSKRIYNNQKCVKFTHICKIWNTISEIKQKIVLSFCSLPKLAKFAHIFQDLKRG